MATREPNDQEKQVYLLFVLAHGIDSFINYVVLEGIKPIESEQYLLPETELHESYFYIMLLDLLNISVPWETHKKINPIHQLSLAGSIDSSTDSTTFSSLLRAFDKWLDDVQQVPLWFGQINKQLCLTPRRRELIYIYANIKKHNFTNLTAIQKRILAGLNDASVTGDDIQRSLPAIEERLQLNEMHTWMSQIAAHLIEVRKEFGNYLMPLKTKSYKHVAQRFPEEYAWIMPDWIGNDNYEFYFWELMNIVRSGPIFKFKLKPFI